MDALNPIQLKRIEAVHRGYLYQHLYTVGCLFMLPVSGAIKIRVERDEDLEIELKKSVIYIQVKTRSRNLQRSDVKGALERFEKIRDAHSSRAQKGTASFRIVSNASPDHNLLSDLSSASWPSDVFLLWPGCKLEPSNAGLPPPWPDLADAVSWCINAADSIPFVVLRPDTLLWKLAARVQFAATGDDPETPNHTFKTIDLPSLFEQIVEQLQDFPAVPEDYRPQTDEPKIDEQKRVRIIAGFSGAGKTMWAAQVASHCAAPIVYFDVSDLPGSAISGSLARELVARFLGGHSGKSGAAILPASSGIEMLRALNKRIENTPTPILVLDNAHRIMPRELYEITEACSRINFVFLVQPWSGLAEAEALFSEPAEWLKGWNADIVAEEFASNGCRINPATAHRWRDLTGGMPLFVKNLAYLTNIFCKGDASRFADEVETESHASATAQETILGRIVDSLSEDTKKALSVLSLSTVPLSRKETDKLFGILPIPKAPWGRSLRELSSCGALQFFLDGRQKTHDAIRGLGLAIHSGIPKNIQDASKIALRDLLYESLKKGRDLARFGLYLRLLPVTGEYRTLVEFATDEFFYEFGDPTDLKLVLEEAVNSKDLDDEGKFYALDALAFWEWQFNESEKNHLERIHQMERIVQEGNLGEREQLTLALKLMVSAGLNGDIEKVDDVFKEARQKCGSDRVLMRILKYNHALALFTLGRFEDTEKITETLYLEYYDVLGLEPEDVIFKNPPQILAALGGALSDHVDDLKHLADCLTLYVRSRLKQELFSGLAGVHALKFYAMAGAYRSAIKIGQDVADDFIRNGDPIGARQIMESHLVPLISEFGLSANLIPVFAQYAVVLAYCGESRAAVKEMERLNPYIDSLSQIGQDEIINQIRLTEAINEGLVKIPNMNSKKIQAKRKPKVGRNDPCPCGSGRKYKKCCLR